ncbi:MAG: transglutaminase-like domain-containing protein [bacterium]
MNKGAVPLPEPASHHLHSGISLISEDNGSIVPLSLRFRCENYNYPGLVDLREREGLEEVVAPGETEFKKMLLLNDWVNSQWEHGFPGPYPPWNANVILPMIRAGKTSGLYAQYAVVMVQACLSLGWQARYVDIAPESKKAEMTHFTLEVWSNQFDKWVLLDPFYGCHFEKKGIPLSALELHRDAVKKNTAKVKLVKGNGENSEKNIGDLTKDKLIARYYHLAVDLRNDHMSRPHSFFNRHQSYLSWRDDFTDGREEVFSFFTKTPEHFNFPMNQVRLTILGGDKSGVLNVMIRTNTPGLKFLEIKDGKQWKDYYSPFDTEAGKPVLSYTLSRYYGGVFIYKWKLSPGKNRLQARSVNARGVRGPESSLLVRKEKKPASQKSP